MNKATFAGLSTSRVAALCTLLGILLAPLVGANAAEIRVLSAAALGPVLKEIAGDFERTSGHKLVMEFATGGAVVKRVQGGETADLVIAPSGSMSALVKENKVDGASATLIAKTGVGVVVRAGAAKPGIKTVDDLKNALLAAKTVSYANPAGGGVAGVHVAELIGKMGIAEQLKPKLRLGKGGDVTEVTLAQGDRAIGLTQISEIVGEAGAEYVGPLPESVQMYTAFSVVIGSGSKQADAAGAFVKFLKGPATLATMKSKGMQGP